ncbi:hypothetical protein [Poseidonocella sp. HB161398]|uniref:hypothetical protein n=1 Tax=Poseidonocella sp. HB161398 TaxID=2320855 RepID=UPI0011086620|nr:hypothetical protein [Poseidonocella sp. HB161398]
MTRTATLLLPAAALIALASCSAEEPAAAGGDPGALACRQQVEASEGVDIAKISARPVTADVAGIGNYDVFMGAESFRCTVDRGGEVVALTRT